MTLKGRFQKKLNEGLAPVILVQTSEDYLLDRVKAEITNHLFPDQSSNDFNTGSFDMETTALSEALLEAESLPFFDEYRLVFIENPYFLTGSRPKNNLDHDEDSLLAYIEEPVPSTFLVIMAPYEKLDGRKKLVKALKKHGQIIDFEDRDNSFQRDLILEVLNEDNFSISRPALDRLFYLCNGQLTTVMNEVEKLKIYKYDDKAIEKEDVDAIVPKLLDSNIFDLNDYVLKRQPKAAIALFKDLMLQGQEPIQLMGLMASQFRLLLQVKILRDKGYQQGELAKELKVHPYRIKLAQQQNHQFTIERLAQAHKGLVEADYRIKTGQVDPVLQFEIFVLKFCMS